MRRWLLIALLSVGCPTHGAWACGDDKCADNAIPIVAGGGSCSAQTCDTTPIVPTNPPQFGRLPAMANGPLTLQGGGNLPAGCAAAKRKKENFYLLLNAEALPNGDPGFRRYVSRKGLNDWHDLGMTTGIDVNAFLWMSGFLCPDPHFQGPTSPKVTMFFSSLVDTSVAWPPPGGAIMRATSADDGATWTPDATPALVGDGTGWPYMPSYAYFLGRHFLAVAWVCLGTGLDFSDIRVYESPNGIDNWSLISTAVSTGDCSMGAWDGGSVNRPRLIVDPTGTKLLMLLSGYPWDPAIDNPTRKDASLGLAVSCDAVNWAVSPDPVLLPTNTPYWENLSTIIPSLTWSDDTMSRLRVYYLGRGSGHSGLAVAETLYTSLTLPPCPAPREDDSLPKATSIESSELGRAMVTASPNPTTGTVTIGLDFSRIRNVGATDVAIFDITGRAVRTLWEGSSPSAPAQLQWDGREESGGRVAAGRYLVRVRVAGDIVGTHLITYLR